MARPQRSASAASTSLAVWISASAFGRRTTCGSSAPAASWVGMPMFAKMAENLAWSDATRRSQPSASPRPPPAATPLTAAIVGFANERIRATQWFW